MLAKEREGRRPTLNVGGMFQEAGAWMEQKTEGEALSGTQERCLLEWAWVLLLLSRMDIRLQILQPLNLNLPQ